MQFRYKIPDTIGFQLAPMLDVVFLLLIFFIVTQTYSLTEQDIQVKLPTSIAADKNVRPLNELVINVRKDGVITVSSQIISVAQLTENLKMLMATHHDPNMRKNQPIRIRGDSETPFQAIADVFDACKVAGVVNISVSTQKPQASSALPGAATP